MRWAVRSVVLQDASAFARILARTRLGRRFFVTLGIETSCDETSVAVLESGHTTPSVSNSSVSAEPKRSLLAAKLLFHDKVTSDNRRYNGIHPINALDSHQECLSSLIQRAIEEVPPEHFPPDLVAVTRGPGMRSSLSVGLDTAKGLAVAWQRPLIAVNHMQAHALTPRLVDALQHGSHEEALKTSFPFLSLLVSGGHTLLVKSESVIQHAILATTSDIAIGDALDKIARHALPREILEAASDTMYGRVLESFVCSPDVPVHDYQPPINMKTQLARRHTRWGWDLGIPLAETRSGSKVRSMEFSFSGLESSVKRIVDTRAEWQENRVSMEERKELGLEAMRVAFEHLASRVLIALHGFQAQDIKITTLVVSGGVASNQYLKRVLRAFLDVRGFTHVALSFPPLDLCTDNAAMIAWTGVEMYAMGWTSSLRCRALRKWSVDSHAEDGGILGIDGWLEDDKIDSVVESACT
ncbi:hypothetical protein MMC25_007425 [Agyrium rufum]|nr:hypothetical protein [Agyrium rufum]